MFYEQLKKACKMNNTSVTATLKAIGIGTANGTYWKNGSIPSSDMVVKLAEFLDVSTDYLLRGLELLPEKSNITLDIDEMKVLGIYRSLSDAGKQWLKMRAEALIELEALPQTLDEIVEEPETRFIEYSTLKVSAGTGQYLDTGLMEQMKIVKNELTADASFAVKITGDSMEPLYEDGDIVLVKSQPTVEPGEVGIFIVGGLGYIKKLGKDRLISVNPYYNDILFHEEDEIYCKGLVIGVLEDGDIVD